MVRANKKGEGEHAVDANARKGPEFADLLKRYRTAAGLTQEELAADAGLTGQAIARWREGSAGIPNADRRLLAEAWA